MFFQNFMETANKLPDDMRLKYYDAIMDYVFNCNEPSDPIMAALINSIKPSLDKVDERGGAREGAGRKSNEIKNNQKQSNEIKPNQNNQSFQETETRNRNIETETEIEKENVVKEKVAIAPRFTKPTVSEIGTYIVEQNYCVDPQAFWDFYESKGWKIGKEPMKDWKAAVRNWMRRDRPSLQTAKPLTKAQQIDQHNIEYIRSLYEQEVSNA